MTNHPGGMRMRWAVALATLAMIAGAQAQESAKPAPPPKGALVPIAPTLPAPVVAAMQDGKYAEAISAFDRLIANRQGNSGEKAYLSLPSGRRRAARWQG